MLKNYLIIALRNLRKTTLFSLINIGGLAIGMTACLLILYFVRHEKSYDRFHDDGERIYRLRYERTDQDGQAVRFASCCPPAGLRIRKLFPEVEKVARIFRFRAAVSYQEKRFIEERMYFAEPEFLGIFKFSFIQGDPLRGISEPNRAFVSQSTARKYFARGNPIGQTISVDKKTDYLITGIFADIPANSHLKFDILLAYPNLLQRYGPEVENSWGDSGWFTYLLFKPGVNLAVFEKKLAALVDAEFGPDLREYKLTCQLRLQPLYDIHLTSHFQQEYEVNGDRDTVYFLSVIALFIIIIAWANYLNLSTARSLTRAKEVGLRKVVGASRLQLVGQFFLETVILNFLAVLLAFLLIDLLLPLFRQITGIPWEYGIWTQPWFWRTVIMMFLASIICSGVYPVIVLSSFKPAAVLKGKLGNAARGIHLRKMMVIFQFIMAFGLLICTLTIFRQLTFMKNRDLGFSIDNKLVVTAPRVREPTFTSKLQTFREQLLRGPGVGQFCVSTEVPGRQILWDAGGIRRLGTDDNKNYQIVGIDYDFVNMFNLTLVSGRNFKKEFPADTDALILNETAARWLGFATPQAAIGGQVVYWDKTYIVVGVLQDYHQQSLKQAFEPHIFRLLPEGRDVRGCFVVKMNTQDLPATIREIKKQFDFFFPGNPFEYFFLDEYYNQQYHADELFGQVFAIFSVLAIFVTSLGILGLSSFMVMQRTKEIGIRKVLGASIPRILFFLSKDFLTLILMSFIIVSPLAYFGISYWLKSFAVRIDVSVTLFLFPLIIIGLITALTIGFYVIKAARTNPIESLRYE